MRSAFLRIALARSNRGDHMTTLVKEYCEICKTETPRCQYYPAGRSRQHGKCLECDRKDARNVYESNGGPYCVECERNRQSAGRDR
jgi:hypothetical protein